jgi:glutamate-ammonia-ligase adenylyltransferase
MRQRIHKAKPSKPGKINVKHIRGGMIDIEFIVQFLILAYAEQHPELADNTGNIALLRHCATLGLIPADLAEKTGESYAAFRQVSHDQSLRDLDLKPEQFKHLKQFAEAPKALWKLVMEQHEHKH